MVREVNLNRLDDLLLLISSQRFFWWKMAGRNKIPEELLRHTGPQNSLDMNDMSVVFSSVLLTLLEICKGRILHLSQEAAAVERHLKWYHVCISLYASTHRIFLVASKGLEAPSQGVGISLFSC